MNEIMVSICCTAYNHENYIEDAIKSFLMQKTNFNFEILIHDDASTDRTADIIRNYEKKYPNIIKSIYQIENQYSKGVEVLYTYNFKRAKGKYIALCEGDDYWLDPNKLQRQFDYMELNPECSLCVHAAEKVSINKKFLDTVRPNKNNTFYTAKDIIAAGGGMFATNSMFFPTKLAKEVPDFYLNCPIGDYPLTVYLSLNGSVFYMDKIMSAYRVGIPGSWTSRINSENNKKIVFHKKRIVELLNEINNYSEYKYIDVVNNKIMETEFQILCFEKRFSEISTSNYKKIYNSLTIKEKIKIIFRCYLPKIYFKLSSINKVLK